MSEAPKAPDPNNADDAAILAACRTIGIHEAAASLAISRLAGLTNRVFRVDAADRSVVVRLAGEGTEAYIDREVEAHNARQAAHAGVSPELLHVDTTSGLMVTSFVADSVTLSPELFERRTGAAARAGEAFRQLHSSGVEFRFRFELFAMIDNYLEVLADRTAELPEGYHRVVRQAEPARQAIEAHPVPLTPCHCDPLCENFLDDGSRCWIVDWEYSGMNDPWWDLADLSVEGGFNRSLEDAMLSAYCKGEPVAVERARVTVYKAMCDLLWTLWGLIQHSDGNPADDFMAYANGRFKRCRALMASAEYVDSVRTLASANRTSSG